MDLTLILFMLRVASALLLIALLLALVWLIWRDYRSTVNQLAENRRVYGSLVAMREIDGVLVVTGDIYPLLPLTSMGRSPASTIPVEDSFASGEHALIARRQGQWWLEDRNSRNGTTLNGALISRPVVITSGDIIGVGSLRYRVDLEA